ncbi:hypothetical protein Bpfe_001997, partial [Biomphalaria pfeifferi]
STCHPIQTPWSSSHPLVIPYRFHMSSLTDSTGHLLQSTDHPLQIPLAIP